MFVLSNILPRYKSRNTNCKAEMIWFKHYPVPVREGWRKLMLENNRYIFSWVPDCREPWNFTCDIGQRWWRVVRKNIFETSVFWHLHSGFHFSNIVLPTIDSFQWTFGYAQLLVHIYFIQNCNSLGFWRSTVFLICSDMRCYFC